VNFVEKTLKEKGIEVDLIEQTDDDLSDGFVRLNILVRSPEWKHLQKKYKGFDGCPKCGGFMITDKSTYQYSVFDGSYRNLTSRRFYCGLCGQYLPIKCISYSGDTIKIEMEASSNNPD
jgi:hypothetical protein